MRSLQSTWLAPLGVLLLSCLVSAQPSPTAPALSLTGPAPAARQLELPKSAEKPANQESPGAGKGLKGVVPTEPVDPTQPSPELIEAINRGKMGTASRLPQIQLRGRILVKDRPAAAILEVDGKVNYMVNKGATVTLPSNVILKITELSKNEIRIEVSPFHETITLH